MEIIIHRGSSQIGGCCTEIKTDKSRILIDLGAELSESPYEPKLLPIQGVTQGAPDCDGVFFTHYHGDHVGLYHQILPGIPLFMGAAAKEIFSLYQKRVEKHIPNAKRKIERLEQIRPVYPLRSVRVDDMQITPYAVDHSAYDAYMYLIETEGRKILHTGDYRLHGFKGKGVLPALKKYIGQVDVLITEGTTLSRQRERPFTEWDVEQKAFHYMKKYKYTFVLCSSTNIDRLAGLAAAARRAHRLLICDSYEKGILDVVTKYGGKRSSLYDFSNALVWGENLLPIAESKGFCMPIRASGTGRAVIERFHGGNVVLIYSMWHGYLDQNPELAEFVRGMNWVELHASGHGTPEQIKCLCDTVSPKMGVIPIHTEAPSCIEDICAPYTAIYLRDGERYYL